MAASCSCSLYTCPGCFRRFSGPSSLSWHRRLRARCRLYVCRTCFVRFAFYAQLVDHVVHAHPGDPLPDQSDFLTDDGDLTGCSCDLTDGSGYPPDGGSGYASDGSGYPSDGSSDLFDGSGGSYSQSCDVCHLWFSRADQLKAHLRQNLRSIYETERKFYGLVKITVPD